MSEVLIYHGGKGQAYTPLDLGLALFEGNPAAALGGGGRGTPLPDVYADFQKGTVRVVGAGISSGQGGKSASGYLNLLTQFQSALQASLATGSASTNLPGDYGQLSIMLAGRHSDIETFNAQSGQPLPSGPILTSIGQSESGGGIPVGTSFQNPAALAFQTPAGRALIMGATNARAVTGLPRTRNVRRARPNRRRRRRAGQAARSTRRTRGGRAHLVAGSAAAKAWGRRMRAMRGRRRRNRK